MGGGGVQRGEGAVEVNGLAIVSSKLQLPPGKMEERMPTSQGPRRMKCLL